MTYKRDRQLNSGSANSRKAGIDESKIDVSRLELGRISVCLTVFMVHGGVMVL